MKTIPLHGKKGKGKFATVDDEDYESLSKYRWHFNGRYVARGVYENGKGSIVLMHRQILNAPTGVYIDHKDSDGKNNSRTNIRPCTQANNIRNSRLSKRNSSGFKGAYWVAEKGKWKSCITVNWKCIHLGYFKTPEECHTAYMNAAIKQSGEFARAF